MFPNVLELRLAKRQTEPHTNGIITHALPQFYFTNYFSIPDGVIGIFH